MIAALGCFGKRCDIALEALVGRYPWSATNRAVAKTHYPYGASASTQANAAVTHG